MANVVDQDQHWLLNCLSATLDPNHEVRCFAEASLTQASLQPGFGTALSKVAANKELAVGLRQLAAVLLKQFVKKHWQEGEDTFEPPVVSSHEKVVIREILLLALDESHKKICTAISMAVASIAEYDWPDFWPDLLPFLLRLIGNQANLNGVYGAMRCLALLSADLDDKIVPTLIPALFPCLLTTVSSPQIYDAYIRSKALSIVYSCTSMLGTMSGVYKTETSTMIIPMLKPWMAQFSSILEVPVQSENPDDWCIRMEVLKCLNKFVQNFSSLIGTEFEEILRSLWNTFISSLRVYEQSSIEGTEDSYDGRYDSDGAEKSLDSFVIQMFELLLTIVGNTRLGKVVGANVKELVYYTISFLQMTEKQVHTWSLDANQFIADEDDANYSCRVSGALLLEEVVNSYGGEGILAIIDAAKQQYTESQSRKVAGSASWWKIREATLFALSFISEQLLEAEDSGLVPSGFQQLVEQIITEDSLIGSHEYPFLYARIFASAAKFSSLLSSGILEHFVDAAMKAITMDVPPPMKVGACRALCQLLPETKNEITQPQLLGLFSSLSELLSQASDETLHMVLETLQATIKAGHESSAFVEPIISPVILNVWALHISDPFISSDALEVLEAIKSIPGCLRPLLSRILPYIGPILSKPQEQADGLVAGSLDLVTMLLKNAPGDVVKAIYDICFDATIRIVLQSEDHSEIQNATECLAAFISVGRQEVLAWGSNSESTMRSLLEIASRLLDPNLESSGSLFVGSYILQLILHLPSQMAVHIHDLVAAVVRRMQSAKIAALRSSLLVVFARLVHMSAPNVGQFIDLLISIPAEGHDNSFAYVMSEWTKQQGEIQGAYQIKVTTSALALLLSSSHVELAKLSVPGHLIKSGVGITTRSKAKSAPDQWIMLPLPTKIVALLADTLIEIQEQVLAGDDEDDDWEEVQTGDDIENDEEFLSSLSAAASGKPTYEHLEAIAKAFNEDQEDQYEDSLLSIADPLNQINLANYLTDFFGNLYQNDRQLFDNICQSLTQAQRNAIQTVVRR
ncbi:importin-9 isoform X1 [Neltuma alba]|uniref:importin-9 isoform X1 n=1 Tax=Neltuma alba TaxID=207710 RepID=UPI0010A408EB|nr:importin-9 isoform X1 [Prosopis alba]